MKEKYTLPVFTDWLCVGALLPILARPFKALSLHLCLYRAWQAKHMVIFFSQHASNPGYVCGLLNSQLCTRPLINHYSTTYLLFYLILSWAFLSISCPNVIPILYLLYPVLLLLNIFGNHYLRSCPCCSQGPIYVFLYICVYISLNM